MAKRVRYCVPLTFEAWFSRARSARQHLGGDRHPSLHAEWLQACGELSIGQLDDPVKLNQALSRVAFDLLVYLHARAEELRREDEIDAVLELHSSDQALVGRSTRGCGLVHCEAGRAILSRAATLVREGLK